MANIKKENSKTWSEEAINTLINCFQSHECMWNVISGDYKDQTKKSLDLEVVLTKVRNELKRVKTI